MVEMQLAHEGFVGPDAAISPQGVDRMGRRRRRALWGAAESSSYSRSYWV